VFIFLREYFENKSVCLYLKPIYLLSQQNCVKVATDIIANVTARPI